MSLLSFPSILPVIFSLVLFVLLIISHLSTKDEEAKNVVLQEQIKSLKRAKEDADSMSHSINEKNLKYENAQQNQYKQRYEDLKKKYSELEYKYHRKSYMQDPDRDAAISEAFSAKAEYNKKKAELITRYNAAEERRRQELGILLSSNLSSAPWLSAMISDYLTLDIEREAEKLDWGNNTRRREKAANIRDIRRYAKEQIAAAKEATYQLGYLIELYPALADILESDFAELKFNGSIPEYDPIRDWLSKEEYLSLSEVERDQLALDRYVSSNQKTKWQIGRDYELSVAYEFSQAGYSVDTCGSYLKLEDMGRDLIASNSEEVLIIQCKYWSELKLIHEKHIFQIYGTSVSYSIDHPAIKTKIKPTFVTNIALSEKARKVASALGVKVIENNPLSNFPRIKCNIGRDSNGERTFIFHLPMDDQYDNVKIDKPGEFYAYTVQEAIDKGFRRAYRWSGKI